MIRYFAVLLFAMALPSVALAQSTNATTSSKVETTANSNTNATSQGGNVAIYNSSPSKVSETLRNTPDVYAPSIVGGDICTAGVSAGGAGPGIGISFGFQHIDKNCEIRQDAALLYNMHLGRASIAMLCEDQGLKTALNDAGVLCPTSEKAQPVAYNPAAASGGGGVNANDNTGALNAASNDHSTVPVPAMAAANVGSVSNENVSTERQQVCHFVVHAPADPNGAAYATRECN